MHDLASFFTSMRRPRTVGRSRWIGVVTRCATRLGLICLVRRGFLPRGSRCGGHQAERDGAERDAQAGRAVEGEPIDKLVAAFDEWLASL
jgi:hypothetical protein